jgi:hypothetical protein
MGSGTENIVSPDCLVLIMLIPLIFFSKGPDGFNWRNLKCSYFQVKPTNAQTHWSLYYITPTYVLVTKLPSSGGTGYIQTLYGSTLKDNPMSKSKTVHCALSGYT